MRCHQTQLARGRQRENNRPLPDGTALDYLPSKRYEFGQRLGRGRKLLFQAVDRQRRSKVALAALPGLDEQAHIRLREQFETWQALQHRNLVFLDVLGRENNIWFYTSQWIHGLAFYDYVHGEDPAPGPDVGTGFATTIIPSSPTVPQRSGSVDVLAQTARATGGDVVDPRQAPTVPRADEPGTSTELLGDAGWFTGPGDRVGTTAPGPSSSRAPYDESRLRHCFAQLAYAVHALHESGLVHGQLEPSCALVTHHQRLVLLDPFSHYAIESGARADDSYTHMAPEVLAGLDDGVDPRTLARPAADWFSVGAMLFQLLTGKPPFLRRQPGVLTRRSRPPHPGDFSATCPADLGDLCSLMLASEPGDRPDGDQIMERLSPGLQISRAHWDPSAAAESQSDARARTTSAYRGPGRETPQRRSIYGETLPEGTRVGSYLIDGLISEGGFASVYRASHVPSWEPAALKVLRHDLSLSPRMLERFWQEARIIRRLRHPNIVELYQVGELAPGRPYIAMEWLPGRTLRQHLAERGPFTAREAVALMNDIRSALSYAHSEGVVHRDIKTENIIASQRDDWFDLKLVDFGIAKLTAPEDQDAAMTTRTMIGTPSTMAPEQILRQSIDGRTDIYALGVVLYQLVCGRLPFISEDFVELEQMHLHGRPPRASERARVTRTFDEVIFRAMAKRKEDRFADVDAFQDALRDAVERPSFAAVEAGLPPPQRDAGVGRVEFGMGVAIEIKRSRRDGEAFEDLDDDADDDLLDALDDALDSAQELLDNNGFEIALSTSESLLGVSLLGDRHQREAQERLLVNAIWAGYLCWLDEREDPRVTMYITVHGAAVLTRRQATRTEMVGGELLQPARWPCRAEQAGVVVTRAALATVLAETAALEQVACTLPFGLHPLASDDSAFALSLRIRPGD